MASLGHIAVAMAAGRLHTRAGPPAPRRLLGAMLAFSALSLLPDADVIAFWLEIPYHAPWGHRGASHSLAAAVALGLLATPLLLRLSGPSPETDAGPALTRRYLITAAQCVAVALSHSLLDALTDGGLGVALYWPLSDERVFAPWRPIPVAPIGLGLLSGRGLYVMLTELFYFAPVFAYALWPRPTPK
ncbi:MAG: metal-dependent hydrolase [Haliangiales bacterium]